MNWNWRVKAVLPVAGVLAAGLALFEIGAAIFGTPGHPWITVMAASGAGAVLAVLMLVLATLIQQPLVELQGKIARVQQGDLSVRVGFARRNDEIGELGRNFNEMVRQLAESRDAIERFHQLEMTRAEHLATLGELAAGLAHEIRNPLAGIAGVFEVISSDLPKDSRGRAVLLDVKQEIVRIQSIVSELLDYARPKPPRFFLADLNTTVERAVALARSQVRGRPVSIRFNPANGLPAVEHDAAQIEQVIINLLINAIQAVEEEGQVTVTVRSEKGSALVCVEDTGKGIAPENLEKIFRPFFTTKGHGTGLGLPMAQGIVRTHGGRIEVSSRAGEGTRVRVWLPLAKETESWRGNAAMEEVP